MHWTNRQETSKLGPVWMREGETLCPRSVRVMWGLQARTFVLLCIIVFYGRGAVFQVIYSFTLNAFSHEATFTDNLGDNHLQCTLQGQCGHIIITNRKFKCECPFLFWSWLPVKLPCVTWPLNSRYCQLKCFTASLWNNDRYSLWYNTRSQTHFHATNWVLFAKVLRQRCFPFFQCRINIIPLFKNTEIVKKNLFL